MFPLLPLWGLRSILQKGGEKAFRNVGVNESLQKLLSKYTHISNGLMRTGEIVAKLFQSEVFTSRERDDIQQLLPTPVRANEQLLNTLMLKDDRAYDCLLRALIETDQGHIADILKCEAKYLDIEHSLMIQRNYTTLVDNIDTDCGHLLDRLYEAGTLSDREVATINAKSTKYEKNETLLDLASRFSPANFERFLQALEESTQDHVASIMTGKQYAQTSTSKSEDSHMQYKESGSKETSRKNPVLQGESIHNFREEQQQQNGHHRAKIIKEPSTHVKRQSIKTMESKFANLPDELQIELSLKVAALHQKTVLPSGANVELCFRKLLQGFIQQKTIAKRKQLDVEDIREVFRSVNDFAQNSAHVVEDKFKTAIHILSEELLLHRTNNRHLDETLKANAIELDNEKLKSRGLESQLRQNQDESWKLLKQKDELLKKLDGEFQSLDEERLLHRTNNRHLDEMLKTTVTELGNEKQKSGGLESQLQENQNYSENLLKQIDELQKAFDDSLTMIDESRNKFENMLRDKDSTVSELKHKLEQAKKALQDEKEQLMNQIKELQDEYSVPAPCEIFQSTDVGVIDVITLYMKDELHTIAEELKECSGSIYAIKDEPGFIIKGNETGVRKAVKDLLKLAERVVMYDHDIDRPGIPAYFYSRHGKEVLRGIQINHKVSIQLDNSQSRAKPHAEASGGGAGSCRVELRPGKFMTLMSGDITKFRGDAIVNAATEDLNHIGGVAAAIAKAEDEAHATQRTRTGAGPRLQSEDQHEKRHPKDLSRIILSIYALSKKAVDDVLKDIEEVIKEYIIDKVLDSQKDQENIAKLNEEQVNRIKGLTDIFPVQIEVETGRLKRIRIRGPPMVVTSVMDQVHVIFQEAQEKEIKTNEEKWIANVAHWEYEDGSDFEKYPDEINAIIERAYRDKKPYAEWEEQDAKYRLTFQKMVEEFVTKSGTPPVKVRRVANDMEIPPHWESMKNDEDLKRIPLSVNDQEYKDVEKAVRATAQTTVNQIVKIERIQNKLLYKQYVVRKAAMDAANPGVQNEMTLWHGTGADTLESINRTGFNRSYCGKNAIVYGRGVYFAKNFSYSAQDTYSPPDANGYKHIYQCKVLTGEFALGNQTMIAPPSYAGSITKKYDSTVDNIAAPTIFVIFYDTQAFPEYLVYFK